MAGPVPIVAVDICSMNTENSTQGVITHPVLLVCMVSGILVAILEFFIAFVLRETTLTLPWTLPVSILFACTLYWMIYAVIWLGIIPIKRLLKLQTVPCAIALALSLGLSTILYSGGLISFDKLIEFYQTYPTRTSLLAFLLLSIWCIALFVSSYFITKLIYDSSHRNVAARITILGFFLVSGIYLLNFEKIVLGAGNTGLWITGLTIALSVGAIAWYLKHNNQLNTQIKIVYSLVAIFTAIGLYFLTSASSVIQTEYKRENSPRKIRKVLLLTIDTLRRDAISYYQGKISTPNLDLLASDSIVFNKAFSPAPWTKPAMVSIMTGLSPCVHQSIDFYGIIPENFPLLSERLGAVGYTTGSVGYNFFLSSKPEGKGLQKGISDDIFLPRTNRLDTIGMNLLEKLYPFETGNEASTDDITANAQNWLQTHKDEDFFLWVHYFDPHIPYIPPKDFLPKTTPHPRFGTSYWHHANPAGSSSWIFDTDEVEWIKQLYLSEVRYVDDRIGKLLDRMKDLGIYDETLIVMSSDHGEEFMEHFGMDHGHSLFNELLAVPLTIKLPESTKTGPVKAQVNTTAITPTILDLTGIPYDPSLFTAGSLTTYWNQDTTVQPEPIYSTGIYLGENAESIILEDIKYIRFLYTGREELYELDNDPGETINKISSLEESAANARTILGTLSTQCETLRQHYKHGNSAEIEIDQQTRESLKSLGYMR